MSEIKNIAAEIKSGMEAIQSKIKNFEATETQVKEANEQLVKMRADYAEMTKRLDAAETEAKKARTIGAKESKSFADALYESLKENKAALDGLSQKTGGRSMELEIKSPITMLFSNAVTGKPSIDLNPNIVDIQRRRTHIRELIPQTTTDKQLVQIVRETSPQGGAGMQTEGQVKSQFSNTLTVVDFKVETIATYAKVSVQMLEDIEGLTGHLNTVLPKKIMELEDTQLLTGTGTSPQLFGLSKDAITESTWNLGAPEIDAQNWDVLARAIGFQMSQNFDVNGIVLNPVDFFAMVTAKGGNGQYVSPLIFQGGQAFIYGVPVFMNTAVAAGKFFLGDWTESYIAQRRGLGVRFFDQNEDDVLKNLITVRAEQRLAHVINRPLAYVFGDFAAGVADLTNGNS